MDGERSSQTELPPTSYRRPGRSRSYIPSPPNHDSSQLLRMLSLIILLFGANTIKLPAFYAISHFSDLIIINIYWNFLKRKEVFFLETSNFTTVIFLILTCLVGGQGSPFSTHARVYQRRKYLTKKYSLIFTFAASKQGRRDFLHQRQRAPSKGQRFMKSFVVRFEEGSRFLA